MAERSGATTTAAAAASGGSQPGTDLVAIHATGVTNLEGLENAKIDEELSVADNANLQSLTGLNPNNHVLRALWVTGNRRLSDLTGLEMLEAATSYIYILDNDRLVSPSGLDNLTSVPSLLIRQNPRLTNIAALGSLETVVQELSIRDNESLPTCQAQAIADQIEPGTPTIEVTGNYAGGTCD
ncbi:hypothetical protein WME73_23265 [Sorangium sp. So ce302]|uniref:hypothetical protein n=1 Tax=Sorangium sp. So ce302 TaxID=3133297 RepID=UPI003F61CF16